MKRALPGTQPVLYIAGPGIFCQQALDSVAFPFWSSAGTLWRFFRTLLVVDPPMKSFFLPACLPADRQDFSAASSSFFPPLLSSAVTSTWELHGSVFLSTAVVPPGGTTTGLRAKGDGARQNPSAAFHASHALNSFDALGTELTRGQQIEVHAKPSNPPAPHESRQAALRH